MHVRDGFACRQVGHPVAEAYAVYLARVEVVDGHDAVVAAVRYVGVEVGRGMDLGEACLESVFPWARSGGSGRREVVSLLNGIVRVIKLREGVARIIQRDRLIEAR